jgi:hypothetical protein
MPISSGDTKSHGKGPQRYSSSPPHKNYVPINKHHLDEDAPHHKTNMPPPKHKTIEALQEGIIIHDGDIEEVLMHAAMMIRHDAMKTTGMSDHDIGKKITMMVVPRRQRTHGARLHCHDKKGHKKQGSHHHEVSQHSCQSARRWQKERPVTLTATTYKLVEVYCLRCVSCKLLVPLEKFISYIVNYEILWSYYM